MDCNLEGRLRKCQLSPKKGLWPIYEAVVNSLQAIEDRGNAGGTIAIHVVRETDQALLQGLEGPRPIKGFVITDNGIGFNDDNFKAFETYDSTYKISRGGKGIGRLLWLVTFDSVTVESAYQKGEERWVRRFEFGIPFNGTKFVSHGPAETGPIETTVRLTGFKHIYRDAIPDETESIAEAVLEHCLQYLLHDGCPTITITDDDLAEKIVINDLYRDTIGKSRSTKIFDVGPHQFQIDHLRSNGKGPQEHSLHFCAHKRSVICKKLAKDIPNLGSRIPTETGQGAIYTGYVSGEYLDKTVNPERTGFRFSDEESLFADDLTEDVVTRAAVGQVEIELERHLAKNRQDLEERVTKVITEEMPEARALLRSLPVLVKGLNPTSDDRTLRRHINEAGYAHEVAVRESVGQLLDKLTAENPNIEQARETAEAILADVTEASRGKLAGYVAFRKAVLQIYEKRISLQPTGKFSKEDAVHDLIFPRRVTSDDVTFDDHNLWIVDDRLAFHQLLASDMPFDEIKTVEINGKKRCDVIVINKPAAFSSTTEEVSSIVIVELKRPQRDDYDGNDNPIDQVLGYIEEIRSGNAKKIDGRRLVISPESPFFVHIVSDITPALKQIITRRGIFTVTPDADGYFGYAKDHRAYIEVISFEKLIRDANKRNRVWFKKLGIE